MAEIGELSLSANDTHVFISSTQNIVPFNKATGQFESALLGPDSFSGGVTVDTPFSGIYPFVGNKYTTSSTITAGVLISIGETYVGPATTTVSLTDTRRYLMYLPAGSNYALRVEFDSTRTDTDLSLSIQNPNLGQEFGFVNEPNVGGGAFSRLIPLDIPQEGLYIIEDMVSNGGTITLQITTQG